ncbi:hypothetical protein KP509_24G043800 [Ceratopteris richardii]|nr:hypothetical protein KP509_24G043800 [Ceratopteris richardii]
MTACKSISASSKGALEQRKGDIVDSIEPSRGVSDQASERLLVSAPDCQGDVPLSESSHEGDTAAMSGAQVSVNSAEATETSKGGADVSPKPKSVQAVSLRTRGAKEKALPVQESVTLRTSDTQSVGTVAKTPSRIPVPSKIFEASRRMFSKDDQQGKTTMPPPKASSVQPSKSSSTVTANTQSRLESTASALKLSTRKFLDRSKAVVPGKLSSNSAANRGSIDIEPDVAQGEVQKQSADACAHNEIGLDEELAEESSAPGPKFDEDLQVEEAQALVQSELKMLEVELEEVAAKLPKLDEACAYQKTPVKLYHSSTSVSTPTRLGLRSNVDLFSSNRSSKQ